MTDKSTIAFIEHLAPTLESGTYEISVHTSFNGTPGLENEKIGNLKEWIFVGGERFNLNPADVDSVYPGENTTGDYSDTFPHIVFSQGGFPWERQPKTGLNERITWLALLLFDEEDPAPTLKQIAIGDLIKEKIPNGFWFPKNFKPEPDEDPARLCNIIDVSKELFDQIKPSTGDLKYMAHAREVTIYNKARQGKIIQGSISDDATHLYSVVIGNRLPKPGKESVVHLVSLESYSDVLDNVDAIEGIHTVRMVSLKSWRFSCSDVGGTFLNHFTDLNGGLADNNIDIKGKATPVSKTQPLFLHYPIDKNEITDPWILKTMQQGYIPMQHKFRQGLSSISWYRGPLVPFSVNSFLDNDVPFSSADALLVYDPSVGYYDVSYAAAWQLGQLLALKNKAFAKAQYFWKQNADANARKRLEVDLLEKELPIIKNHKNDEDGDAMLLPDFTAIETAIDQISMSSQREMIKGTIDLQLKGDQNPEYKKESKSEWYQTIQSYIESLRMLHDVPWNYLVPDNAILPQESIRFFYVDPNWITALVDGALSIGDVLRKDQARKEALLKNNTSLKGSNTGKIYGGFLLRSSVLKTWPGLEVRAFGRDHTPLLFYRYERLAEDVIICIVEGEITEIEFREPPEGLHFGVKNPQDENGLVTFSKEIRSINGNQSVATINFTSNNKRVVKMKEIGEAIKKNAAANVFGKEFSQADFGFVMVQPVSSVRIKLR